MFVRESATKGKRLSRHSKGVYFTAPAIYVTFGMISSVYCYTVICSFVNIAERGGGWPVATRSVIYRWCFCCYYYGCIVCRLRSGRTRARENESEQTQIDSGHTVSRYSPNPFFHTLHDTPHRVKNRIDRVIIIIYIECVYYQNVKRVMTANI